MPIFLVFPASIIERMLSIKKFVKKIGYLLIISMTIILIIGTVYVNCLMRTNYNEYEVSIWHPELATYYANKLKHILKPS